MRARLASLPIKTRIALWIGSISTVLLVLMALAVYGVFAQQLMASLDQTVELRSTSYEELIDFQSDPPALRSAVTDADLGAGEAVLRLYDASGALLQDASPKSESADGERALVHQVATSGQPALGTIDLSDNEDYRVLARPVGPGPAPIILVSGLELSRVNGPLRLLRIILAIAVPVTAAGASLAGYWVATRALEPVAVMAETARRITRGDLSQRVPGDGAGDELGHLAATLNTMIDRIDETLRRERRFTADASHELRTPLAAIDATIDVTLARPREEGAYRAALTDVRAQANRLTQLTGQLLLLSRLDALEFRADFVPVDLADVLAAVSDPFLSAEQPLEMTIAIGEGEHQVLGDFELLARAFFNIIDNAVKYGGPAVSMAIHLERQDRWEIVRFADHGVGMPAALVPMMFERFHRGDTARATPGAGLGLSIVQAIVEVHEGTIAAEPTPGGGMTIVVRLPAALTPKTG